MLFSFSSLLLVTSALCLIHHVDFDKACCGNGRLYNAARFMICLFSKTTGWAFRESEEGEKREGWKERKLSKGERKKKHKGKERKDSEMEREPLATFSVWQLNSCHIPHFKDVLLEEGWRSEEVCVLHAYMLSIQGNSESTDVFLSYFLYKSGDTDIYIFLIQGLIYLLLLSHSAQLSINY